MSGPDDPAIDALLDSDAVAAWRDEIALVETACGKFDLAKFRDGTLTPVFFGSALKNFGVRDILEALIAHAPPPRSQKAATRTVEATEQAMTGVVFKIQANMDPNHRDRIAFMRVCSGKLTRGMKVKVVRTEKTMALTAPQFFFAQDRSLAEEAYAGDVVGIPNRGALRIGDAVTEGEDITFLGIPSFAPEILRRIRLEDAIRAKKLREALREMAEEGVVQLFSPLDGTPAHRRRDRQPAARRAGRSPQARVRPADRLRPRTVRYGALDRVGQSDSPGALRREEPLGHRHRPRRRPGVSRHLGLQSVMDGRAQSRGPLRRHQDHDRIADFVACNS